MRYFSSAAFLNQIKNAKSAGALSRSYWVAVANDYERNQIVESLLQGIDSGKENLQRWTEFEFGAVASHLQTPTLFGDEPIAILENADAIIKANMENLEKLLPQKFGYLICCAKSKCAASSLVETAGVVLDLLTEKPWEKEKRIQGVLEQLVLQSGKTMTPNALSALMETQDLEEGILEREIEKLVCYSGDRLQISLQDVQAICRPNRSFAVWQTAELVVWEGRGSLDPAHFHVLVPALRSQLQLGLKIATLLEQNASKEEWSLALPKVFQKTLDKRTRDAGRLGARYFTRGLETLFEIELKSRMGSQHLGALLDYFHCSVIS